jgi:hypothetical protein
VLLTVKSNQKTLYRQIGCQFQGKRQIPFTATDQEEKHGRDTTWELKAREAPEHIKANWPGSAWIVEVITDTLTARASATSGDTSSSPASGLPQKPCCDWCGSAGEH